MRNITLRQMRAFAAVARLRSFTRAAQELHLTQPAVSQQLKLLEAEVGMPLFEHMGRSIHLTAAGEELPALREAGDRAAARGGRDPVGDARVEARGASSWGR